MLVTTNASRVALKRWRYIWLAGVAAGAIDMTYACVFWAVRSGLGAVRIFQSVAAGVIGWAAFSGGKSTAPLGLGLHFGIALSVAAICAVAADARWTTEATHPDLPGAVIHGSSEIDRLEGERFLIYRSHYDHPDIPDAISIIGDTDGLQMHDFDTHGVHRILKVTVTREGWEIAMGPARIGQRVCIAQCGVLSAHDLCLRERRSDDVRQGEAVV